jgi:AraC-like DNA-binding protein
MIQDARPHLRNGELVKEFYQQLGFQNPNHFARAFRRLTKRTPTAARLSPYIRVPRAGICHSHVTFQKGPKSSK